MNDLRCRLFGHRWGLWYSVGVWRCRECMRCGAIDEYRPRMSVLQLLGLRIGCAFEQFQTAVAAQLMPAFARLGEALRGINPPRSRLERAWDWFVEKCGAGRRGAAAWRATSMEHEAELCEARAKERDGVVDNNKG